MTDKVAVLYIKETKHVVAMATARPSAVPLEVADVLFRRGAQDSGDVVDKDLLIPTDVLAPAVAEGSEQLLTSAHGQLVDDSEEVPKLQGVSSLVVTGAAPSGGKIAVTVESSGPQFVAELPMIGILTSPAKSVVSQPGTVQFDASNPTTPGVGDLDFGPLPPAYDVVVFVHNRRPYLAQVP